ncbi:ribonuclease HII [Candidatus Termititenax persephonae]|uniref:Ribonuclease HII n=1 Tax=Candidatus Termititenax persephonae TaxID=2218525 RepID=A0A388THW6_9BACT|nr:ribonuclease HII [Candidatus Termititenax persephonae]
MLTAGVDEAGRGPLAGPVIACALVIPSGKGVPYLIKDSKKLSEKQRAEMFEYIQTHYLYGVGQADHLEIDRLNILQATFLAMRRAVTELGKKVQPDLCLIDGNKTIPRLPIAQKAVVKGDALVKEISAASIVAKVTRDRLMLELHTKYPQYNFAENKGYCTDWHVSALRQYGRSPVHRVSFMYPGEIEQQRLFF